MESSSATSTTWHSTTQEPPVATFRTMESSEMIAQSMTTINWPTKDVQTSSVQSLSHDDSSLATPPSVIGRPDVMTSHVILRCTLSRLPPELQDQIFTFLSPTEVHVFLFHRGTHVAAMDAIWRGIKLADGVNMNNKIDVLFFKCLSSYPHHLARTRVFNLCVSRLKESYRPLLISTRLSISLLLCIKMS
jgi:hypothetical protein